MSFYTALTGLNGSQADIAATSNNIANVGTTGFKRSRAEFGDIFATSPLQNSSSSIGSGSILKGVKQQFTQGNIAASLNALDLAISGQGFFALKPSLTSSQVVYTRNGSFNVDNNRNVVDSTGQFLLTYPVNEDGSVTSKTINDAVPLQLPVTSGEPKATGNIDLSINLPADAPVITDNPKFADGYQFSTSDPESFTNSTSLTIFDDLGNPTIATVYFIKTQAATADDPTNKYDTRLVIDETVINPDLVASVNDNGEQLYIDRFGKETTVANIPDDNYFSEGKGSPLYRRDNLNQTIPSQPAKLTGSQSSFDFGEEGNKLIEITNDPMMFKATREAGNSDSSIFWGKDFLLVNVDDGDVPVSVDLRPGFYNATQLAEEVERAINDAYGDDNKLQVRSNVDDTLTVDFFSLNTGDGTLSGLTEPVTIDLLKSSYVSDQAGIVITGSSPDFTREQFLAHAQVRIIDTMNDYVVESGNSVGVESQMFTRSSGAQMSAIYENTEVVTFDHAHLDADGNSTTSERHLAYSYYNKAPSLSVYENKTSAAGKIVYDAPNNVLTVDLDATLTADNIADLFSVGEVVRLAGNFTETDKDGTLNGRELTILGVDTATKQLTINTTGEGFPDAPFTLTKGQATGGYSEAYILSDVSTEVEAFFEGADLRPKGAVESFNNKKIVLRETQTAKHAHGHNDAELTAVNADQAVLNTEYYALSDVSETDGTTTTVAHAAGTTFTSGASPSFSSGRIVPVMADDSDDLSDLISGKVYQNVTGSAVLLREADANAVPAVTELSVADGGKFRYDPLVHTYDGLASDLIYSGGTNTPTTNITLSSSGTVDGATQAAVSTSYYAINNIIGGIKEAAGTVFTAATTPANTYHDDGTSELAPTITTGTSTLTGGKVYQNVGSSAIDLGNGTTVASGASFSYDSTAHASISTTGTVVEKTAASITSVADGQVVFNTGTSAMTYLTAANAAASDITAVTNGQVVFNTSNSAITYLTAANAAASDISSEPSVGDVIYNSSTSSITLNSVGPVTLAAGAFASWTVAMDLSNFTGLKAATGTIAAGASVTTATGAVFDGYTDLKAATGTIAVGASVTTATGDVFDGFTNVHAVSGFSNSVQATSATGGTDYYAVEDVISIDHLQGSTFTTGVTAQTFSAGSLANVTTGANLVEGTIYQYVDKNDNGTDKTITASVAGGLQLTTGDTFQYDASTHSNITSGNFVVATATGSFTSTNINSGVKLIQLAETFTNLSSESLAGADTDSLASLGLSVDNFENKTVWVDEKNPPIKISYDAVNQRFQFGVNHTAIGPGTDSNFRAFKVYGASDADGTNNLGIPASDSSPQTEISSTAVISAGSFVADGTEMQINAKRFGANVQYNSDTKTFTFLSGTTGEAITADGALSVETNQAASNIQVGRYRIDAETGEPVNTSFDTATRYMGTGDNGLMGVGASKNDTVFETARGLASQPARAVGASATEPLNEIFALSSAGGGNVFNISVNGTSGIIEVPSGNYVGSTLAAELQTRINQISDSETGAVVGGVTVQYQPDTNNFVFTTGTTGDLSTIKVKGAAKLGLDDVPLGVGSVPTIVNLVQATNDAGVPLFVNAAGEIVETPPDNLVTDYYPLYIDEGELTFDKTGQIISPLNRVHYEQQAAGFSISLDVDYSQSTQLSQPFSVNNLEQDGFTSGRLDGLDIDATGLLRANYTNGENRPLGKIVLANFNNQNGLKQVGNATFVETATSGTPTFGEAGAEGFGAIQSGSLERSNVDITEELVNLITAQRNFQASSKAIETSTQLTQAIINIRS